MQNALEQRIDSVQEKMVEIQALKIDNCLFFFNKNVLRSVESRLLEDKFLLSKAPVLLYYFFVWNTRRVLYVILYIIKM